MICLFSIALNLLKTVTVISFPILFLFILLNLLLPQFQFLNVFSYFHYFFLYFQKFLNPKKYVRFCQVCFEQFIKLFSLPHHLCFILAMLNFSQFVNCWTTTSNNIFEQYDFREEHLCHWELYPTIAFSSYQTVITKYFHFWHKN